MFNETNIKVLVSHRRFADRNKVNTINGNYLIKILGNIMLFTRLTMNINSSVKFKLEKYNFL